MRGSGIGAAVIGLCAVVGIALGHYAPRVRAQVPGSVPTPSVQQPDLMSALLAEVKAIRVEVREAARASARSQLLLGRVQLQEMHLGRLDEQLALASARRLEAARDRATTSAQIRELEHQRTSDMPADQRGAIDADLRRLRAQLQDQHSLEQQFHRQESEVMNALTLEEQRLRDLSAQLDALK
jgi:hypothetical protein